MKPDASLPASPGAPLPCACCGGTDHACAYELPSVRILQCRRCGLQFLDRDIYSSADACRAATYVTERLPYLSRPAYDAAEIEALIRARGKFPVKRLLEIGVGFGHLASALTASGYEVYGTETNPVCLDRARGCAVRLEPRDLSAERIFPDSFFDCVLLINTIEHIRGINALLDNIRAALKPGGLLLLYTNNNTDCFNRICRSISRFVIVPYLVNQVFGLGAEGHWYNFSPEAMRMLLRRHGFSLLSLTLGETPAASLTDSRLQQRAIDLLYGLNRLLRTGKLMKVAAAKSEG